MTDEQTKLLIKYGIGGSVMLVYALIASCHLTKQQITAAIEAGATPMEARCALSMNDSVDCRSLYLKEAVKP